MPTRATEGLRVAGRGTTLFAAGATADARIVGGIDSVREGLRGGRVRASGRRWRAKAVVRILRGTVLGGPLSESPAVAHVLASAGGGVCTVTSPTALANRVHPRGS